MNETANARTDDEQVLVRTSRESDVEAMLAIYRHHVRNGVPRDVEGTGAPERTICATGAEPEADPPAASGRDLSRRGRRLCLRRAVPQAAGLSLHRQAFDLRSPRATRPRGRTAAAPGIDRCLCSGRLPPDDRLYRRRQRALAGAARKVRLRAPACSAASPIATAAGPTPSWCSDRSAPGRRRPRPSRHPAAELRTESQPV